MRFWVLVAVAIAYLAYVNSDACVQCNSKNDTKCATDPAQFFAKDCANSSKCYTRVLNGDTIRGCASELDNSTAAKCNNENECLICTFKEGCNRQIFPEHRASCLQCQGEPNSTCANDTYARPVVCPIYKIGDKCFIRYTGKNDSQAFSRGCLTSAQKNKLCVDERNCYVCEGPGCNLLEFNSTNIPLARDSAIVTSSSVILLLLACIAAIFY